MWLVKFILHFIINLWIICFLCIKYYWLFTWRIKEIFMKKRFFSIILLFVLIFLIPIIIYFLSNKVNNNSFKVIYEDIFRKMGISETSKITSSIESKELRRSIFDWFYRNLHLGIFWTSIFKLVCALYCNARTIWKR